MVAVPSFFDRAMLFRVSLGWALASHHFGRTLADDVPYCDKSALEWFQSDVQPGHRGYKVSVSDDGKGIGFTCISKGANDSSLLDPVVHNHVIRGMFSQKSMMPCKFAVDELGVDEPTLTAVDNSTGCGVVGSDEWCTYPGEDDGQWDWGGPSFKVSMVNDYHTTEDEENKGWAYESPFNRIYSNISHASVYGVPNSACKLSETEFLYNSSAVFSTKTLSNMKYKVFAFASDDERLAALADSRNEGLQYAASMKGENGCDVEILYEFKPKSGGGLSLNPSLSLDMTNEEMNHILLDSSSAYQIPSQNIAIMQFSKAALRESQYLSTHSGCDDDEQVTAVKFSTQFVCKATGERVNVTTLTYKNAYGDTVAVSTDPDNATYFQPDPNNPTSCYYEDDCNGYTNDPDLFLELSEASAPESCGWMYWDPLVTPPPGDGKGVDMADATSSSDDYEEFDWLEVLEVAILVFAVLVVGAIAYCVFECIRRRRGRVNRPGEKEKSLEDALPQIETTAVVASLPGTDAEL